MPPPPESERERDLVGDDRGDAPVFEPCQGVLPRDARGGVASYQSDAAPATTAGCPLPTPDIATGRASWPADHGSGRAFARGQDPLLAKVRV